VGFPAGVVELVVEVAEWDEVVGVVELGVVAVELRPGDDVVRFDRLERAADAAGFPFRLGLAGCAEGVAGGAFAAVGFVLAACAPLVERVGHVSR
jgi:hypothetical protein